MTIVRRPSPFGDLMSLRSAMDRLFEDSFVRRPLGQGFEPMTSLPLDVTRTADELIVEAALPGIKPDDVDITIEDGTLSIRGEFREDERNGQGETLVSEIRRGTVARAITLPTGLEPEKAEATFEHGVLTLRIPKAESVKPRQIRISPTVDGSASRTSDRTPSDRKATETKAVEASTNGQTATPAATGTRG